MGKIILITGGARSGKSSYAQKRAEALPGKKIFLATCPVLDQEMGERIQRHREDRADTIWQTIEEETDLFAVLNSLPDGSVCLLDCVTLWINNLMYHAERANENFGEDAAAMHIQELLKAAEQYNGTLICVSNEVGMGVVPDSHSGRVYRDCVGRCNRLLADAADEVYLVSCGIPLPLRPYPVHAEGNRRFQPVGSCDGRSATAANERGPQPSSCRKQCWHPSRASECGTAYDRPRDSATHPNDLLARQPNVETRLERARHHSRCSHGRVPSSPARRRARAPSRKRFSGPILREPANETLLQGDASLQQNRTQ